MLINIPPSSLNRSLSNFNLGVIMHSHLSWRVMSSLPTSLPSQSFIKGLFALSLYTHPSLPVLYGGSIQIHLTLPAYIGRSAFRARRLSPSIMRLPFDFL